MSQVTFSVRNEKLQDVLHSLGIDNKSLNNFSSPVYKNNFSRSVKETAKSLYMKYLGWEYYSNELEFE